MTSVFFLSFYKLYTSSTKTSKVLYVILIPSCLFNVIAAGNRGIIFSFGIALIILFFFFQSRKRWGYIIFIVLIAITALCIITFFFSDLSIDRLVDFDTGKSKETMMLRLDHTLMAFHMFLDHPIIGHGPYGFIINFNQYKNYSYSGSPPEHPASTVLVQILSGKTHQYRQLYLWTKTSTSKKMSGIKRYKYIK